MRTKRVVLFSCVGLCLVYLSTKTGRYYSLYQDYMHNPRSRLNFSRLSTEDHHSKLATPPFTAVIILTYMRSGSSLTGDILQQSPGAFYIYEPLHGLQRLANNPGSNITFINGTVRFWYQDKAVSDMLQRPVFAHTKQKRSYDNMCVNTRNSLCYIPSKDFESDKTPS